MYHIFDEARSCMVENALTLEFVPPPRSVPCLGMLAALDAGIGNVTRAIKAHGLYDNSVIVFSSDNVSKLTRSRNGIF